MLSTRDADWGTHRANLRAFDEHLMSSTLGWGRLTENETIPNIWMNSITLSANRYAFNYPNGTVAAYKK